MAKSFRKYNLKKSVEGKTTKYPFTFPGEGDTGEFLMIRSQHSEEFRAAQTKAERQIGALIAAAGDLDKVDKVLVDDIYERSFAVLVESWSFEEPCNEENVMEFFAANPQAHDDINRLAAKDTLFFAPKEKS